MNGRKSKSSAKVTFYFIFYNLHVFILYMYSNRKEEVIPKKILSL